jgi:hypothetical protein
MRSSLIHILKKRGIMLLFLLLVITINLQSQTNYFNNYHNPNGTYSANFNIYPTTYGYVCSGLMGDSVYYFKNNIVLSKTDTNGNLISFKEYKLDSSKYFVGTWGGGGFTKCVSGGYILGGDIEGSNSYSNYLMRLNDNFDTIWTKILYKDTFFSTIAQCIESSDKGFVLCGQRRVSSSNSLVLLIKTDSLGNKLWEKYYNIYGVMGDAVDKAWNVTETPEKGYLLGCYTFDMAYQGTGDGVVIKTDSLGNVQWTKNVGGPEGDISASVAICKDSNYLVATVYSYFTADYNDHWRGKLRLMKITPANTIIWDKQYEPEITSLTAIKVKELANGDIVVGGTKIHQISEYKSYNDSYLFKVDANGNSIWYREYAKSTDTNLVTWNNLYNFEQTPDGGFVACGKYFVNTQIPVSSWVFKTDSLGCLQPGCQYVGVKELQTTKGDLNIFPNPATTQTTITYPTTEKAIILQLYNMLGQLIYEEKLSKGNSQTTIDTRAYKKGLYKVVVGESSGSLLVNNE